MILLLVVTGTCFVSLGSGQKLHEHMTREEIESVFNVNHNDIHQIKYEVVPIYHRTSELLQKGTPRIHFGAFDEEYDLYLENNNHVLLGSKTPIYSARRSNVSDDDITYQREPYPFFQNVKLFHNIKKRVAIAVHANEDNKVDIYGLVGDDVLIRPLPSRIHKEVLLTNKKISKQYSPSTNFTLHGSNINGSKVVFETSHHVVIKLKDLNSFTRHFKKHGFKDIVKNAQEKKHVRKHKSFTREESPIPDTLYPQLLVVVDYETYKFYKNMKNVVHYMATFWNAVDLRFRELKSPEIRLNIAGLVISMEPGVLRFMETYWYDNNSLLASETLTELGEYFAKEKYFSKDSYDVVFGITYRNLCSNYSGCNINGIAYETGVCLIDEGYSSALIRDKGGFAGITTAAHELGHVLGAPHDGMNVPGGPCNPAEGYLMSYKRITVHSLEWSNCSKTAIRALLNDRSGGRLCLDNKPDVGTAYPKYLPGRYMSRDEQCRVNLNLTAFEEDYGDLSVNCYVLSCKKYINGTAYAYTDMKPPAEGTSCGDKKICLNGLCVDDLDF